MHKRSPGFRCPTSGGHVTSVDIFSSPLATSVNLEVIGWVVLDLKTANLDPMNFQSGSWCLTYSSARHTAYFSVPLWLTAYSNPCLYFRCSTQSSVQPAAATASHLRTVITVMKTQRHKAHTVCKRLSPLQGFIIKQGWMTAINSTHANITKLLSPSPLELFSALS